jgi:predicted nucleotidyltransferase
MTVIKDACAKLPVRMAYLHGSYASGHPDGESDIDIALLADSALSSEQRSSLRIDLQQRLFHSLPATALPDLDVVVLQDAPVLLQYHVIRRGIVAFERSPGERIAYTIAVEQAYDDEAPYLVRESQITLDRILSHAL